MKTKLATAIAFSLFAGHLYAAPTLYGEIDASVDYLPEKNATISDRDVIEVTSNVSLLGIKGDEKINDRLSFLYLAEWGIVTDGDGTDLSQRNRFVGIKDLALGSLKIGKQDTPLKQLSSPVDSFNNYVANRLDITGIAPGENRIDNSVVYEIQPIDIGENGKLKFNALLATGEAGGIAITSGGAKVAGRGLGDAWSAALQYDSKPLVLGIAYDKAIPSSFLGRGILNASQPEITGAAITAAANTIRAVARYNGIENLALKALYQTSEVENKLNNGITTSSTATPTVANATLAANIDQSDGWLVGAEYNFAETNWTVKAQYSQNTTSFKNATADYEAQQIAAGVDYAFNKQIRAYGYAGYLTLEQGNLKNKQPVIGTGLEYKF